MLWVWRRWAGIFWASATSVDTPQSPLYIFLVLAWLISKVMNEEKGPLKVAALHGGMGPGC